MFPQQVHSFYRSFFQTRAGVARIALAIIFVLTAAAATNAATFPGTNLGAVPDGGSPNPTCGAPRDVNFAVSGVLIPLSSVVVDFTMTHTWIGDLQVSLIAPDGTTHFLFTYVGRTSIGVFGDNSNMSGTYTFSDLGSGNIWAAAAGVGNNANVPAGFYRTQAPGPFSPANPGPPFTSMDAAFAGVTTPNGNWTLRIVDCAAQDLATVTAANLTLTSLIPTSAGLSLGGRAMDASGRGHANVQVTISGGNLEAPMTTITNPFGYFRFDDLPAGLTYVVEVSSKRAFFNDPVRIVNLDEDLLELNFISSD